MKQLCESDEWKLDSYMEVFIYEKIAKKFIKSQEEMEQLSRRCVSPRNPLRKGIHKALEYTR